MHAVNVGLSAGVRDWRTPEDLDITSLQWRYTERWLLYKGELFLDAYRNNPYKADPRVYRNISLLWNHTSRVVDFYPTMVYQGALRPEPESGAIPIKPDPDLTKAQVDNLMRAINVLEQKWNWQQQMVIRPKLGAALGDVLTELIDDADRRFPYPKVWWPGYVKAIELDYVGNVRSYTLEYDITEKDDRGDEIESYTFRKEVDADTFRYFKDDKPFDYYGEGAVVRNIYGFVPAIWDRHIIGLGARGDAATDVSRQALFNLNSLFSHSRDFQHKAFIAPIIVRGKITKAKQTTIDMSVPQEPSAMAQSLNVLESEGDAGIEQATFDIGQTIAELELMRDGILATHPEATFFQKLADQSHVTGPGADKIIMPVKGLVEHARNSYDPNTVHLFQMAISMCGMRVANGDWSYEPVPGIPGARRKRELDKSRKAFAPFTLESYKRGEMDFTIADRDIVPPSQAERVDLALRMEALQTAWGLERAGLNRDDAARIIADRTTEIANAGF